MLKKEFDLPNFSDELVDKWEQTGFLDDLTSPNIKVTLSNIFEYLWGMDGIDIRVGSYAAFAVARLVLTNLTPLQVAALKEDFTKLTALADEIFDRVSNLYEEHPNGFKHLGEGVDWEAELTYKLSEDITTEFA